MATKKKATKCATKKCASKPAKAAKPVKKKTAKAAAKKTMPSTEFRFYAPDAQEVFVAGEFDQWDTSNNKMRRFRDGFWRKKIKLQPGRYEYRFIVDGDWCCDPECGERCDNNLGAENSVMNVQVP